MKILKSILGDNANSVEARERGEHVKAELEIQTAEKASAIDAAHAIQSEALDAKMLDTKKARVLSLFVQAEGWIADIWKLQIESNARRKEKFPNNPERLTYDIDWKSLISLKHFLSNVGSSYSDQELISYVLTKKQELKDVYLTRVAELESQWYIFTEKFDESDFE